MQYAISVYDLLSYAVYASDNTIFDCGLPNTFTYMHSYTFFKNGALLTQ